MTKENQGFSFKQFHVNHHRCAMKVGTDGILLGAWADIQEAQTLLDLGTGTGLIALMLAQRTAQHCQISAVERDHAAAEQAKENLEHSPWAKKMTLYHTDIATFAQNPPHLFDLIVANPPYFSPAQDCKTPQRNLARYTLEQSHNDWLNIAAQCLNEQGKIQFILPYNAGKILQKSTALYCTKQCDVITKIGKPAQRLLLTFRKHPAPMQHSQLIIYDENNQYHPDFVELTKAFYLKF
ncbi:tRNA1(Val) (adenine(37)-N6)-methyltransferase [Avibacterium sp. 20-15]|uniref:tRNA1(Val) (adenine(37)-N6)-methyltransferase n=1 Tax=unclassified Avibacterium TaxID=2685287 RepID=UPI002025C355|nr:MULTISPECIES: tRNA1(Val) (adenine(37)-N6)-methyltransferase [unclassified Avibacterium]MCW9732980.1 tRNA1(Val) (adenine(37)-N6)-methyltransferase [Avibacterium sp. 20-15]URL05111.1 tRNA1(Val) (adenine(37)-N6)-methyltransferase [Avibacterium sp. 20-132]